MAKHVPITSITVDRELEPGDDVSNLARDIRKSGGLSVPVLTDGDLVLIDGLRRLRALESLGYTEVEVVSTSMFPVACEVLTRAREHGVEAAPMTPKRTWQIYQRMSIVLRVTKSHLATGRPKGTGSKASAGGRPMLAAALGYSSVAPLQAITNVYRKASEGNTKAKEAVALLESGETTIYGAVDYVNRTAGGLTGPIVKYPEQKNILDTGIASLRGLLHGLSQLGPLSEEFPGAEKSKYLKELLKLRRDFYRIVKLLDEEINQNVQ